MFLIVHKHKIIIKTIFVLFIRVRKVFPKFNFFNLRKKNYSYIFSETQLRSPIKKTWSKGDYWSDNELLPFHDNLYPNDFRFHRQCYFPRRFVKSWISTKWKSSANQGRTTLTLQNVANESVYKNWSKGDYRLSKELLPFLDNLYPNDFQFHRQYYFPKSFVKISQILDWKSSANQGRTTLTSQNVANRNVQNTWSREVIDWVTKLLPFTIIIIQLTSGSAVNVIF